MTSLPPNVGIQFHEIMSGHITDGFAEPAAGERDKARARFRFDLTLKIPSLQDFIDAPIHIATIPSGVVTWDRVVHRMPVLPDGTVVLYRPDTDDPKLKYFDFTFSFDAADGARWDADGHKYLRDEGDAVRDLSRVFLSLRSPGRAGATGATRVHPGELVRQLSSLHVTGAVNRAEKGAAKKAFLGFVNQQLRAIYGGFPQLFPDPGTAAERSS